jgi:hypothetical protein
MYELIRRIPYLLMVVFLSPYLLVMLLFANETWEGFKDGWLSIWRGGL